MEPDDGFLQGEPAGEQALSPTGADLGPLNEHVSVRPGDLSQDAAYNVLVAGVSPRPIALVSSLSALGTPNLAPFSFFMAGGVNPLSVAFSATTGSGGPKNTLSNVLATGEFVLNTVHGRMADGMNRASFGFGADVSEWESAGFTMQKSELVSPFRVAESLVQFECRVFEVVRHGEGPGAANYVIGEVVQIHVARELWDGLGLHLINLRLLARMAGPNYLDSEALKIFELQRPGTLPPEER